MKYPRRAWTDADVAVLRQHYANPQGSARELAKRLGRTTQQLTGKASLLGLRVTALRGNAERGVALLIDPKDTGFAGTAEEVPDEQVIAAVKSVPVHY